jgi:hypothetical protein
LDLEEEFTAYRLYGPLKMERLRVVLSILDSSIRLRKCCRASKLVCRILIPKAAGGLRLRYNAHPWTIIAYAVYGDVLTLKISEDEMKCNAMQRNIMEYNTPTC